MTADARKGFTLLEVMVAVAILALALTALFSSEVGAVKMAHRARKMEMATLLARCKMNEIEAQVAEEGMPAVFETGTDACCEDAELEGYSCDWEIKRIVLPDSIAPEGEDAQDPLSALAGGSSKGDGKSKADDPKDALKDVAESDNPMDALGQGGLMGGAMGGGLANMAIQFTYPILRPAFEEQIRRATVTVRWEEGDDERSFDVVQFLVADQGNIQKLPEGAEASGASSGAAPQGSGNMGGNQ